MTVGAGPVSSTADERHDDALRVVVLDAPSANRPAISLPPVFGSETKIDTCRVTGSAVGLSAIDRADERRPSTPRIVNRTLRARADLLDLIGRHQRFEPHARRIDDRDDRVPGATTSPRLAGRSLTTPANGALHGGVVELLPDGASARARGGDLRLGVRHRVLRLLEVARGERAAFDERARCAGASVVATASAVSADLTAACADANAASRSRDAMLRDVGAGADRLAAIDGQRDDRAADLRAHGRLARRRQLAGDRAGRTRVSATAAVATFSRRQLDDGAPAAPAPAPAAVAAGRAARPSAERGTTHEQDDE